MTGRARGGSRPVSLTGQARGIGPEAPFALADLLSRRGLERPCETLVAWAREA